MILAESGATISPRYQFEFLFASVVDEDPHFVPSFTLGLRTKAARTGMLKSIA